MGHGTLYLVRYHESRRMNSIAWQFTHKHRLGFQPDFLVLLVSRQKERNRSPFYDATLSRLEYYVHRYIWSTGITNV